MMHSTDQDPRPLRVLHVYRTYFPETIGGLQEAVRQICHTTAQLGTVNRVFTLARDPQPRVLDRDEATVYRFPLHVEISSMSASATALAGFRQLAQWADIINYHHPWPFADALHALARVKTPAVVTYHSDIVRQRGLLRLYSPLMHWFLSRAKRIVATSPQYRDTSPVLARYAHKVELIPLALDEETYPSPDPATASLLKADYGDDFFLFVGVLRYYKGLDVLLDAVVDTDLRLLVVGTGAEEAHIRRRIAERGMTNVQMLGLISQERKVALMSLARAVVLPSHLRSEAFGIALLEGAMLTKPLVSCEIGSGTSYVNRHNETGLTVPPGDPAALRRALVALKAEDALALRLGRGARARYERLFKGRRLGEAYLTLYRDISGIGVPPGDAVAVRRPQAMSGLAR